MENAITYRNLWAMGTRMDIVLPGQTEDLADEIFQMIRTEVNRLENILSIYRDDSDFSKINKNAFREEVFPEAGVFRILREMQNYSSLCLGYFDISMGLFKTDEAFKYKPETMGMDKVIIDNERESIKFLSADVQLDSGAFGKGMALDSVKNILKNHRIYSAFISFGESSVLALGKHPHGDCWKIGIQDLYREGRNIFVFDIVDASVSTSGNSPQNLKKFTAGHLLNPKTGKGLIEMMQLCVVSESALEAEILSTALMFAGEDESIQILSSFKTAKAVRISYPEQGGEPEIYKINF